MSDRELMQQALEDLRMVAPDTCVETIEALRARLAEPDDEPVGRVTVRRLSKRFENHTDQYVFYPADQSPYLDNVDECFAVYTRPAARKVRPLTDEQMRDALRTCPNDVVQNLRVRWLYAKDFARAIERAHGITGDSHE